MKPITTNSLSAWGYIGLLILFNLPVVSFPAIIICAFLVKDTSVRNFARAFLIIELIIYVIFFVLGFMGVINFNEFFVDFDFPVDGGTEVFNNIRYYLG